MKLKPYISKYLRGKFGREIGRGMFTRVYRKDGDNFVTLVSTDKAKECAAQYGLKDPDYNGPLFPDISFLDDKSSNEAIDYLERNNIYAKIYQMEYFPKVKSLKSALKPDQWELYKALKWAMDNFHSSFPFNTLNPGLNKSAINWQKIDHYRKLFREIDGILAGGIQPEIKTENIDGINRNANENTVDTVNNTHNNTGGFKYSEIMIYALESLINYGDSVSFEISPRNVAVNPKGELILLDVFYFRDDLVRG